MYHVCFSNPHAWRISYENGVYGNVQRGNDNLNTFWGKIIDLLALKPGDRIFFYVIEEMSLYGVFEVLGEPYYCEDNLFKNKHEKYPFRFNFNEIKNLPTPIPASELANLIENGLLYSIPTFERDRNASFRGIKQLTNDEGMILEETFLKFNPKANLLRVKNYNHTKNKIETAEANEIISAVHTGKKYINPVTITLNLIPVKKIRKNFFNARYEKALQGYIFYSIRRGLNNVIEDIDASNFSECLMEVPMLKAQQFRSDILCLYRNENTKPHFYSIIETKKDKEISISDLSQLIGYMKNFSFSKGIPFNCVEGVYISMGFKQEAIEYLHNRKKVEKENPIRLIRYSVDINGKVSFDKIII